MQGGPADKSNRNCGAPRRSKKEREEPPLSSITPLIIRSAQTRREKTANARSHSLANRADKVAAEVGRLAGARAVVVRAALTANAHLNKVEIQERTMSRNTGRIALRRAKSVVRDGAQLGAVLVATVGDDVDRGRAAGTAEAIVVCATGAAGHRQQLANAIDHLGAKERLLARVIGLTKRSETTIGALGLLTFDIDRTGDPETRIDAVLILVTDSTDTTWQIPKRQGNHITVAGLTLLGTRTLGAIGQTIGVCVGDARSR